MPTLRVDRCTCSTAMAPGGLISLVLNLKVFAHETGHVFNAADEYTNQCSWISVMRLLHKLWQGQVQCEESELR